LCLELADLLITDEASPNFQLNQYLGKTYRMVWRGRQAHHCASNQRGQLITLMFFADF
jgi:hypothetical protein